MVAIEQISKGAQNQSKAADTNRELSIRLETSSKDMAGQAEDSGKKIEDIKALVTSNKANVETLISNISKGADASRGSVENVKNMEESTTQINKIVEKIVNVALQTNMLAVNGSIEAARAGEFGRGFSVVAGDIRTLANDSSENAEKIQDMVRAMQGQIHAVSRDLEQAANIAVQEVENSRKTIENLDIIETDMDVVQKGVVEINSGAMESLAAIEQAGKAVEEIANGSEEASKVAQEAGKAAAEGSKGMEQITEAIEDIASQADEMQNMGG
jgi:methyl-accepting chemotaxis protein